MNPLLAPLNALLEESSTARAALVPFAGQSIALSAPPFGFTLAITDNGFFAESTAAEPSLALSLPLTALPFALEGKDRLSREVQMSGNIGLARALEAALASLPLAFEARLERHLGPVFGHQAALLLRSLQSGLSAAHASFAEASTRYVRDEAKWVVTRAEAAPVFAEIEAIAARADALAAHAAQHARA